MDVWRTLARSGLGLLLISAFAGCGAGSSPEKLSLAPREERQAAAPFTHKQKLIQAGARVFLVDGCSACHMIGAHSVGPDFEGFAGHEVHLADGRTVLVDEAFLRHALSHPAEDALRGYDPRAMQAALRRADVPARPRDVEELAAFIEEIGPEPG